MKRTNQILSIGFLALLLFLNIGLTLSLNSGLHAHILGNNQILVHFHNSPGGEHSHSNTGGGDCGSLNFVFTSILTFLNNAQGFEIKSTCIKLITSKKTLTNKLCNKETAHTYFRRGPPAGVHL